MYTMDTLARVWLQSTTKRRHLHNWLLLG